MKVALCIPSARPLVECKGVLEAWRDMGYLVHLWRDPDSDQSIFGYADSVIEGQYPGYAEAANALILQAFRFDPDLQWAVTGGDDTLPDPNKRADEIAFQCGRHFGEINKSFRMEPVVFGEPIQYGEARNPWGTFGVMQPTGDRYASGSIDRIAGSPWIGREFGTRMYGGHGPYWPEYTHMGADEELMYVAEAAGVYWRRPDLCHLHRHFQRESDDLNSAAVRRPVPPHLVEANSPEHWQRYKRIFGNRKSAGFPGSEPI